MFGLTGFGMRSRRGGVRLAICLCVMVVVWLLALVGAGASWGDSGYNPALDPNSMYNTTLYSGAQAWWSAGYAGNGVDVAVIDTGVSPVAGLNAPGKVIYGPDLSFESGSDDESRHLRRGTFMARADRHDAALTTPYAHCAGFGLGHGAGCSHRLAQGRYR
jgi:subtilisin family serine protease